MTGYVHWNNSNIIMCKIENVQSISYGHIKGDSEINFDGGSSYIILETDTINLNTGDVIDITGLEDCRDYFLKGKDYWYMQKLNKSNEESKTLQDNVNNLTKLTDMYSQTLDTIMFDVLPSIGTI